MNATTIAAAAVAGLTTAVLGFAAPAAAAPMHDGDAAATIGMLEADGHRVIVNRLSDLPLDQADVLSVNRGPALRGTVMDEFGDRTYQRTITGYVYYINVG